MTLAKKMLSGYIWSFFGQWIVRLTGLASMLVLVRILSPADFGLMALAMLVVGFFDIITSIGVERYILLQKDMDNHLLDSGWTINILFRLLMVTLIYLSSNYAANYFSDTRLAPVLEFICITQMLSAFKNIGMVKYIKAGNFKPATLLGIVSKLLSTGATLYFAVTLRNYWCMVYGTLVFEIVNFIGSYCFSTYRPKLNFRFKRELFSFTYKLMFRTIASFARSKVDVFLVGKGYGTDGTGKYSVAQEFAILPFVEVIGPATLPVFSGLVQYKNNKELLYDKTFKYLSLVYLFIIPSIVGIFITAEQIGSILLGNKWVGIDNTIQALAVLMLPFSLQPILNNLYDCFDRPGINAIVDVIGILLILYAFYFLSLENVEAFAEARSAIGLFIFFFMIVLARIVIKFSIKQMLIVLFIPCVGSSMMLLSFYYIYMNSELTILGLILNILFGATVYFAIGLLLFALLKNRSSLWHFGYSLVISVVRRKNI